MDSISGHVLESAVAILSGGFDQKGNPLIVFPTDSADLIDVYSYGDILRLLRVYADIAGDKVAVVADLKHGWTEECITKLTSLLDELQSSKKGCIAVAYFVKPCVKTKKRILHRQLSRIYSSGRLVPYYEVRRVESFEELYGYIDKAQLTLDYGGTLQYNHSAWVDFQKTYLPVVTAARELIARMPAIKDEVHDIKGTDTETCTNESIKRKEMKARYETVLEKHKVRQIVETCKDSLDRLDHPEHDSTLIQIHATMVVDTVSDVRKLLLEITSEIDKLDVAMEKTGHEQALFGKLKECRKNAQEVLDTIELMKLQVPDLPLVGRNVSEAQTYRADFTSKVIEPSKDIVNCATAILMELDTGKDTTPKSYSMAFEVAKQLTEALQPFTRELNQMNDTYTRIHLFYVIFNKTKHWKEKATGLIIKELQPMIEYRPKSSMCVTATKTGKTSYNRIRFSDDVDNATTVNSSVECVGGLAKEYSNVQHLDTSRDRQSCRRHSLAAKIRPHSRWSDTLDQFYYKHPAPRKKHLKIITKFAPACISKSLKTSAEVISERTLFILAFLERDQFKVEDILTIQQWSIRSPCERNSKPGVHFDDKSLEVTLV